MHFRIGSRARISQPGALPTEPRDRPINVESFLKVLANLTYTRRAKFDARFQMSRYSGIVCRKESCVVTSSMIVISCAVIEVSCAIICRVKI